MGRVLRPPRSPGTPVPHRASRTRPWVPQLSPAPPQPFPRSAHSAVPREPSTSELEHPPRDDVVCAAECFKVSWDTSKEITLEEKRNLQSFPTLPYNYRKTLQSILFINTDVKCPQRFFCAGFSYCCPFWLCPSAAAAVAGTDTVLPRDTHCPAQGHSQDNKSRLHN